MKLVLIGCEAREFESKKDGETISGYMYSAIRSDNKPIQFWSTNGSHRIHEGVFKYSDELFVDLNIAIRVDNEKFKYKEKVD